MYITETERKQLVDFIESYDFNHYMNYPKIQEAITTATGLTPRADFFIADGASKYVIIFTKKDYVLKWSYDDSVETEFEIYGNALMANIAFFFPQTEWFYRKGDILFTLQQKIDYDCTKIPRRDFSKYRKMTKTVSKDIIRKVEKGFRIPHCSYNRQLDGLWASVALSLYGKFAVKQLCDFIQKYRINDLHRGNIGFYNSKPIILDFCGYENYETYNEED